MRGFGRQCRGQGQVLVTLVRHTAQPLLRLGEPITALGQQAQHLLGQATAISDAQRTRITEACNAACSRHRQIRQQSTRLIHGQQLPHCQLGNAYEGKSNCPAQFGRKPGIASDPATGFIFANPVPTGNPSAASSIVPLVDTVQAAIARVTGPGKLAIHAVASDLGANDPSVRQTLHARGILTVGIPTTVEPIKTQPTPEEILAESGKRDYSHPLLSEPDVKVSLHPAQASQRPCEGPVSSHTTCWLHDTRRSLVPYSAPRGRRVQLTRSLGVMGKVAPVEQRHRHLQHLLHQFSHGSRAETPQGSLPAFASGDVASATGATRIHPMTGRRSLFPTPIPASPLVGLTAFRPSPKERYGLTTFPKVDTDG